MQFEVSVIIPVYNAGRFVGRAVESALQFECVKEVILIEDGSPDDSLQVCKTISAAHPAKVRLLQHPGGENKGAAETRNVGLENARYEFIAFLDADDYYLENRFDRDIEVFSNHADADGTHNALGISFENDDVKAAYQLKGVSQLTRVSHETSPDELKDVLLGTHKLKKGYFHLDTFTLKKNSLQGKPGFNPALRLHQDTEWILKLAFELRLYTGEIAKPVAIRHIHPENRITRFKSYASMALMQESFYAWIKKTSVERKYKKVAKYNYISSALSAENTRPKRIFKGAGFLLDGEVIFNFKFWKLILKRALIVKKLS